MSTEKDQKTRLTIDNTNVSHTVKFTTTLNTVITIAVISFALVAIYFSREYINEILIFIQHQNPFVVFLIYVVLFITVSFPIIVGYLLLIISAGYILGFFHGMLVVAFCANFGIAIAHNVMRILNRYYPIQVVHNSEFGRAILKVLAGAQAFKLVLFTRLTPIPFGLQNAIFALSIIPYKTYHVATFLGLLPAQLINVYLGSTLRDMHDVLNNHELTTASYIIFGGQILIGISLMLWVLCKARIELDRAIKEVESSTGNFGDNSLSPTHNPYFMA